MDDGALDSVYDELRAMARSKLRDQAASHTLQPTALVNEVCLRLIGSDGVPTGDRLGLQRLAARAMKQVLIDHARGKGRAKRGGDWGRVTLQGLSSASTEIDVDAVELGDALEQLKIIDGRQAEIVELRFFSGLELAEIADVLGVSLTTVKVSWRAARAWLKMTLSAESG